MMQTADTEASPHIAYCGGSFGRVSLMAAGAELADHARECTQILVNVHPCELAVRVDGAMQLLRPFDAAVIGSRQTYAIPRQPQAVRLPQSVGFLLVKAAAPSACGPCAGPRKAPALRLLRQSLAGYARVDAEQLVAELLRESPDVGTVERGVLALQAVTASLFEQARAAAPAAGLHECIAREAEAGGLDDLLEFSPVGRRAAAHGVSERHFLTLFRRATRLPPKAFYNMRRLEAAFALLSEEACSITDIAYRLGFSAPPHFTRFMRTNTGWTPSGYRARLRGLPAPLRPRLSMAGGARA